MNKDTVKRFFKKVLLFITNPRLLLCFGIAWIITNGWSYILLGIGTWLGIAWMQVVAGAWLTFLWIPGTPEKLMTVALSIILLRFLFPNDQKTLQVLKDFRIKTKEKVKEHKEKKGKENRNP